MIRTALQKQKTKNLPAVLDYENPTSYAELARQAAVLQAALPPGNGQPVVAILLPDGAGFLSALFAVLQAGWTAFPLNTHLSTDELSNLLRRIPVHAIFTDESLLSHCQAAVKRCPEPFPILCLDQLPPLSKSWPEVRPVSPDTPMLLLASSGTTGRVKLVKLSERNMDFNVVTYLRHMGYGKYRDRAPRYALGTPFFGIYGLLVAFSCVMCGFPLLPMAEKFTLDMLYRGAQDLGISHYDGGTLVAVLMDKTLNHSIPYDISSLRYFGFGGSKVPDGTLERLSAAFPHIRFWSGYGMTEASPLIAQPFQELPLDKLGSVGFPLPGTTVLLETENGRINNPNQPGEIVVRGPNVMLGYYDDEAATRKILREGWLHTGDIGYFDEDGYLYICGRKKNMILVRGFNVYPEEVETCLLSCPLVTDCMVYGESTYSETETVSAQVVPSTPGITEEAIYNWCAAHLAAYKCPRQIQIVERLEKTSTGKIRRTGEDGQYEADSSSRT